jgi:hypothetical protein
VQHGWSPGASAGGATNHRTRAGVDSCSTVGARAQAPGERQTQTVRAGAHPCSTAGAPARAPGERPTNKGRQSRIGAARRNYRQISRALLTRCSGGAPGQAGVSDQPQKAASSDSLRLKRWGGPEECLRWRVRAAPLEPRRKRRGSDQPIKGVKAEKAQHGAITARSHWICSRAAVVEPPGKPG